MTVVAALRTRLPLIITVVVAVRTWLLALLENDFEQEKLSLKRRTGPLRNNSGFKSYVTISILKSHLYVEINIIKYVAVAKTKLRHIIIIVAAARTQ